ncbi:TetR family transcriptional regulator [Agromyces luteolus]|uniref:TetR family transcriptional regulator n=1 Tax=Agromyces luteolus TaxID=88373 RepID=A0A7C9I1S7_9MICO|nr:TetR/AcrR family transcriptional regulator [Agromyces luteolus]MUN08580.1 TetR family transcriptional regulator [Agromyces luteolus]GLK27117.1 TetR family transcriptional regulator [Agromyces luteolus]
MSDIEAPRQRADAIRNRDRILEAAVVELARDPDASLSAIGKRAGVGQGTLYRNFPDREALLWAVYRREVQELVDSADRLLSETDPASALREWMGALSRFALAKADLGPAMRPAVKAEDKTARPGYAQVVDAVATLLTAGQEAGVIRSDITSEDFVALIAGIWQIPAGAGWEPRMTRLLDLVMDALRTPAAPD